MKDKEGGYRILPVKTKYFGDMETEEYIRPSGSKCYKVVWTHLRMIKGRENSDKSMPAEGEETVSPQRW